MKCTDIHAYIESVLNLRLKYKRANTPLCMIVCCSNLSDTHYWKDNCLFIIKKVDNLERQRILQGTADNNYNFYKWEREYELIVSHFNIVKQTI